MKERLDYFIQQVRQREGEHEQSLLRVFFALPIFLYLLVEYYFVTPATVGVPVFIFSAVWFSCSILLVIYILYSRNTSRRRQWVAMFADISAVSVGMLMTQEAGVLFYGIYLWVITGNGIRYGKESLISAYVASLLGFSAVIFLNDYWHDHLRIAVGLWLTLLCIPLYILKLRGQLNDALEKAQAASRAKSDFLSNMSHEMRTPLNGVIGASDLLLSTRLDDEQKDLVSTLKKSAHLLLQLIDNILDLSKIESGKLVSEKVDFDLHKLVNNTLEMFLSQVENKRIGLSVRFTPETCFRLQGDPLHLQQVLINLVGNAIKFTSKGSVELRISTLQQDDHKTALRFEVIDTGIGIPQQAQARIFESFTQADQNITRIYGGTGLGTTISKQLVELMGGQMGVQSEPDIGSIFWFEVTFDKQAHHAQSESKPVLDQLYVLTIGLPRNEQLAVTDYTNSWGIRCEHAASLTHFFTYLIDKNPARPSNLAILCFPQSIGMTAQDFAANIRELRGKQNLSPILLNPDLHNHSEGEYLDAGYSCLLRTPLDKTLLFNALHGIMAPRPSEGVISFKEHYERSTASKRGVRILVAEDNGTSQQIIAKILTHGNHKVDLVENGEQALDKLEENTYDLLILDMNMPFMGGLEVIKVHRALSRQPIETPAIILTANATPEARQECERAGIDAYLTKPVDALTLLDTVARLTLTPAKIDAPELAHPVEQIAKGLINEDTLHHLALLGGNQEDFLQTVIYGFLLETEKLLEALRIALSRQDYATLKELAHILKGSSGNVGAEVLFSVCSRILTLNEAELRRSAADLLEEASGCYPATRASLLHYLNGAHQATV
ncbi:sensor histidine kinase RcsC [Sideroxyarcus emersonii]|uniref:Sensory/regulatory protein RpfC n=1 Tax=Sideroxyarcus emersonii TaxID=2764705 RepID=A0AAN2BZA9_9PROT|nr:ATP-binding protein [Sideroxyarcus emersonii]BCK87891.1 sensor histidine kinase RcsC [Sideroxyarcus emersonii]